MFAQLIRKSTNKVPPGILRRVANLWAPFFGAGIDVVHVSPDYRHIRVELKYRWYNKNYVGTHFGGSMYAMTDPFYMMMLIHNLGKAYIVWDKGAKIDFIKPGRSTLTATFSLDEKQIRQIKQKADSQKKYVFDIPVEIFDTEGDVVATIVKTLYVRKKTQPE